MKENTRKFLAMMLSIILIISIMSVLPFTAFAINYYTVDISSYDAFRNATNGKGYDIDGWNDYQCWDGAALFWQQLGMFLNTAHSYYGSGYGSGARTCWEYEEIRNANSGNQFELVYDISNVKRGDIVILTCNNEFGHIAFADENYTGGNYIRLYGQNQNYYSEPFNTCNYNVRTFLGAFRYKGWGLSPSFAPEYLGDHFFANIIHQKSGKAVAAIGDSAGSNVQINTHNGSLIQKWEFVIQNDGSYRIVNNHSGKSLDVNAASDANNTNVHIWDTNETLAQFWYLKKAKNGYQFVPKCALNSALDLENGSTANGTNIQIYSRFDNTSEYFTNQVFSLNYLPSFEAQNLGNHFFANIIHQKTGKAVVAVGDGSDSNVEIDAINNSQIQKWEFIRKSDFSYRIINNYSGKYLDVNAGSDANNTNVHIWESNESAAQLWYLKKAENGYQIVPKCALNSALDLENGSSANGTNIQIYSRFDKTSQYFTNQVFNLKQIPSSTHTPGDINDDGEVNNKDLTRLFQYLSEWDVAVSDKALDVNGDGDINNKDLTRLFQYLSEWEVEIF